MWKLIGDENFNSDILRGLLLREPTIDIVRTFDVCPGCPDPLLLEWAADHNRLLLTHDRATIPDFAYDRVFAGRLMPGVIVLGDRLPVRDAIDQILLLIRCSDPFEWNGIVLYLPL